MMIYEHSIDKSAKPDEIEALRAQLIASAFETAEKLIGNILPWDTSSSLIVLDPSQYEVLPDDAIPDVLRSHFTVDDLGAISIHFSQQFEKDPPAFEFTYMNRDYTTATIKRHVNAAPDTQFEGLLQMPDEMTRSEFSLTPGEMSRILATLIDLGVIVNSEGVTKPSAGELQRINPQDIITARGIEAILVNRFGAGIVKDQSFTVITAKAQHYTINIESFIDQPISIEIQEDLGPSDQTDIFAGNVLLTLKVLISDYRNAIVFYRTEDNETKEITPDEGDLRRGLETIEAILKSLNPSKPELPLSDEFPQS